MPDFEVTTSPITDSDAALVVVGAASGGDDDAPPRPDPSAADLLDRLDVDLADALEALDFDGSPGSVARIPTRGQLAASTLLIVGIGEGRTDDLRRAGAAAASVASRLTSMAIGVPSELRDPGGEVQAFVEGVILGAYQFDRFKSDADAHALETVTLHTSEDVADAVRRGQAVGGAACLVRDLVNLPPGDKRPPAFAAHVGDLLADLPVEVSVLDTEALQDGGYGGLLGVGAGSTEGPRLVELTYDPDGATRHVALVGKGITFDTGGLSLKPSEAMETMKVDMGGAAAVLGTVKAAAELGLPVRLTGLLALAENMPSGTAIRPSDVLTIRGGKTVEVMNTDAEGRLVLADALVHAQEGGPDVIVDVATLTGGALVALGERIGVVMSSDDALAESLLAAGERTAERFWRLPLAVDEYRKKLDSDVADIKNTGGRNASTITAGIFLHHFVEDEVSWAHLDIAGVAWGYEAEGYTKKGGTGAPVRLLVDWLTNLDAAAG